MNKEKPLYFYMANLGSEVERIFVFRERGMKDEMINASSRAEKILSGIIETNSSDSARKELLILKDVLFGIKNDSLFPTRQECANYFFPFVQRVILGLHG